MLGFNRISSAFLDLGIVATAVKHTDIDFAFLINDVCIAAENDLCKKVSFDAVE